jgi:hypothetical protein
MESAVQRDRRFAGDGTTAATAVSIAATRAGVDPAIIVNEVDAAAAEGIGSDQPVETSTDDQGGGRVSSPVRLNAAPAGAGKTTATAERVAKQGSTIWLTNRHEDARAVVAMIEENGGRVGYALPLCEETCRHSEDIAIWQAKGYPYRRGYCTQVCELRGVGCRYLDAIKNLDHAPIIVTTKALARSPNFFQAYKNTRRRNVVIDEDPIALLRPSVTLQRQDLEEYLAVLPEVIDQLGRRDNEDACGIEEAEHWQRVAHWCHEQTSQRPAIGDPAPVEVPDWVRRPTARSEEEKRMRKAGLRAFMSEFYKRMRRSPKSTVRNLRRDFVALGRAAGGMAFVTSKDVLFHVKVTIPRNKEITVLDATANPNLLRPLFHPREIKVLFGDAKVEPAGRIIQVMDAVNPMCSTTAPSRKMIRLIDAIGDRHPDGGLVVISHKAAIKGLMEASKHTERIIPAHFGAVRGRNDLETTHEHPIGAHIIVGSPKTSETDRQQLALAVYGTRILPFPPLETVGSARRYRHGAEGA